MCVTQDALVKRNTDYNKSKSASVVDMNRILHFGNFSFV